MECRPLQCTWASCTCSESTPHMIGRKSKLVGHSLQYTPHNWLQSSCMVHTSCYSSLLMYLCVIHALGTFSKMQEKRGIFISRGHAVAVEKRQCSFFIVTVNYPFESTPTLKPATLIVPASPKRTYFAIILYNFLWSSYYKDYFKEQENGYSHIHFNARKFGLSV